MARAYIGTSGFTYPHWKKVFYPEDVPQKRWLEYYAEHFNTLELNNTFYQMPKPKTCQSWFERTPDDFTFATKLSRVLTHRFRLTNVQRWLEPYLNAVEELGDKLGVILAQLPPRWRANPQRLAEFFKFVPASQRWAFEFRDASWLTGEVYDVLRQHKAALVIHDIIADHPREVTADFVYLRFHGATARYSSNYSRPQLQQWAKQIKSYLRKDLDVYAYFNNDAQGYAVKNAIALKELIGAGRLRARRPQDARARCPRHSAKKTTEGG